MFNYFKISKFFLLISVLAIAIVTPSTLFPFIVGKYVWFRTSMDLALIFFLLGLIFSREASIYGERIKKFLKSPLAIALTVFVFFFVLASLLAFDPGIAFWSNFERGEGGLQMLHLLVFFWLALILFVEEKDWRKIFWLSIIAGLLMTFYGVAASLKYSDAVMVEKPVPGGGIQSVLSGQGGPLYQTFKDFIGAAFNDPSFRFAGSIGNPAYVAAYAIFMIFYVLMLRIWNRQKKKFAPQNIGFYLLIAVFLAVFYLAGTRGAFMGLVAAVIGFLCYFIYIHRAWRKWLFLGGVLVLLAIGSLVAFQNTPFVQVLPAHRIFDISFTAQTFATRIIMWQIAWAGWKARPVLGWGPENYLAIFDRHFNTAYFNPAQGFGAWFDRSHSIYFDYLAETGILGFLGFIGIFIIFGWQFLKKTKTITAEVNIEKSKDGGQNRKAVNVQSKPYAELGLILATVIAYLVQGIVLFDVLPIYINIFLVLAFAAWKFNNGFLKTKST